MLDCVEPMRYAPKTTVSTFTLIDWMALSSAVIALFVVVAFIHLQRRRILWGISLSWLWEVTDCRWMFHRTQTRIVTDGCRSRRRISSWYGSDEPITTTTLGENDLVGSLARFRLDSNRGTLDWQDEGGCVYPFDAVIHSYISLHSWELLKSDFPLSSLPIVPSHHAWKSTYLMKMNGTYIG